MGLVFLIGRVIVGVYFLMNAYNHLVKGHGMVGYAASKGVKHPKQMVMISGLLLLVGGFSVLFGVLPHFGVLALLLFFVPVTFKMHDYWKETDPMMKMNQKIQFTKNMAIVGLLLMTFAVSTPWPYAF